MKIRHLDVAGWLHGLGAAGIGGGSSAVTAGLATTLVDPKDFGLSWQTAKVMVACFVIGGLTHVFFYLRDSPMPKIVEEDVPTEPGRKV